jgi:phosphatidylglycerol:prolipoprotein diacylglycerol transferase
VPLLAYVHDLSPFALRFGEGFGIRWYGLAYVAAFLLGYGICLHLARRGFSAIPPASVADFITGTALFGVVLGGRLGYMLFYDWENFSRDPLVLFKLWDGGMSSHGGIIGIVAFTFFYARRKKIPWLNVGDTIVVAARGAGLPDADTLKSRARDLEQRFIGLGLRATQWPRMVRSRPARR